VFFAGIEGRGESVFGGVAERAHVQQVVGRRVQVLSTTELVDPSRLLLGVELEVHIKHGAVLHLTS
jgi:hypothetical protein